MKTPLMFLVALVLALVGCGGEPSKHQSIHPRTEVDGDFRGYELQQVMAALDEWEAATNATFDRVIVPHLEMREGLWKEADTPNRLYIFREERRGIGDCPMGSEPPAPAVGDTVLPATDVAVVCVVAGELLEGDHAVPGTSLYKGAVAHEVGHSLGLKHSPAAWGPALMYWRAGPSWTDKPTADDVAAFRAIHEGEP